MTNTFFPPMLYRQREPEWAALPLGFNVPGSTYTLAGYGCLLTCFAMLAGVTPAALNQAGRDRKLFSPADGNALTFQTQLWAPGSPWVMTGVSGRYARAPFPEDDYNAVVAHLREKGPVILEVQWPGTLGQHFVLAVGAPVAHDRTTVLIVDPEGYGNVEELRRFYGPWARALVRAVYYEPLPATPRSFMGKGARAVPLVFDAGPDPEQAPHDFGGRP